MHGGYHITRRVFGCCQTNTLGGGREVHTFHPATGLTGPIRFVMHENKTSSRVVFGTLASKLQDEPMSDIHSGERAL